MPRHRPSHAMPPASRKRNGLLPAEWEPQAAVLIAWPHEGTDWAPRLLATESSYVALASSISRFERVLVCVPDAVVRERAAELLRAGGADLSRVGFVEIPYDDTWLRDSGPLTLRARERIHARGFPLHRLGRQVRSLARRRAGRGPAGTRRVRAGHRPRADRLGAGRRRDRIRRPRHIADDLALPAPTPPADVARSDVATVARIARRATRAVAGLRLPAGRRHRRAHRHAGTLRAGRCDRVPGLRR